MANERLHAGHGFHRTHIKHHHDGSHTVRHEVHPRHAHLKKDVEHAVGHLDELHDSLQDHLGLPNPGEAEANRGEHGIPEEHLPAEMAAAPAPAPVGAAPAPAASPVM